MTWTHHSKGIAEIFKTFIINSSKTSVWLHHHWLHTDHVPEPIFNFQFLYSNFGNNWPILQNLLPSAHEGTSYCYGLSTSLDPPCLNLHDTIHLPSLEAFCKHLDMKISLMSGYLPQLNSQIKRLNYEIPLSTSTCTAIESKLDRLNVFLESNMAIPL